MLCSSPLAWGRVPIVGNIKVVVLSERMVKNGSEKLVVRWKTSEKDENQTSNNGVQQVDKIAEWLGQSSLASRDGQRKDKEFVGLFIFEFDDEGRVLNHTIELADVGSNWEPSKTSRFISVTDWLLGRAWNKNADDEGELALGCVEIGNNHPDERTRMSAKTR